MKSVNNKKVGVFLVGSRKSGTTSLANLLSTHPDISLSKDKEPNFFNVPKFKNIDSYHSLFDWDYKIQLEASTSYTADIKNANAISEEIHNYNPSAKIIYIVRNPIDRIRSHYRMSYERGDLNSSLNQALETHSLLLDCSRYYSHINNYINYFGRDNILILNSAELNNSITKKHLLDFLKLSIPFKGIMRRDNAAETDFRMPRKIDGMLKSQFFSIIKKMFPKSVVSNIKSKYYHRRNNKMTLALSTSSKEMIQNELLPEMKGLQQIVNFDITPWIQNINDL